MISGGRSCQSKVDGEMSLMHSVAFVRVAMGLAKREETLGGVSGHVICKRHSMSLAISKASIVYKVLTFKFND
jgi:hypothetical protein